MSESTSQSQSITYSYVPICNGTAVPICTVLPTTIHQSTRKITFTPTETVTLTQLDGSTATITYPCEGTKIEKCFVKPSKGHKQKQNSAGSRSLSSNFRLLLCLFVICTLFTCETPL